MWNKIKKSNFWPISTGKSLKKDSTSTKESTTPTWKSKSISPSLNSQKPTKKISYSTWSLYHKSKSPKNFRKFRFDFFCIFYFFHIKYIILIHNKNNGQKINQNSSTPPVVEPQWLLWLDSYSIGSTAFWTLLQRPPSKKESRLLSPDRRKCNWRPRQTRPSLRRVGQRCKKAST